MSFDINASNATSIASMSPEASTEYTTTPQKFWLKTATCRSSESSSPSPVSRYGNLYLRLHGGGIDAVVLTEKPPIYLRPHMDPPCLAGSDRARVISISTAERHAGRWWGLVLSKLKDDPAPPHEATFDSFKSRAWEEVQIVESIGGEGWAWEKQGDEEVEVLKWRGANSQAFKGFMVCEWSLGHPQLFWMTKELKRDVPNFCERVDITREFLVET